MNAIHKLITAVLLLLFALMGKVSMANPDEWIAVNPAELQLPDAPSQGHVVSMRYVTELDGIGQIAPFKVQKTEVSCRDFLAVNTKLDDKRRRRVSLRCEAYIDEPVTGISLQEARDYCKLKGGRLPTEQHWLAAALYREPQNLATTTQQVDIDDEEQVNFIVDVEDALQQHSGLIGMLGNVWEMTDSVWDSSQASFVIKGGAFDMVETPYLLNPLFRAAYKPEDTLNKNIGFRCIQ